MKVLEQYGSVWKLATRNYGVRYWTHCRALAQVVKALNREPPRPDADAAPVRRSMLRSTTVPRFFRLVESNGLV